MWNTARGDILWESINMGKPASRFWNGRWEIIFLPIALFYRFCTKTEFLLMLQTFIVSLGIIPIYMLMNPVIHNPNLFDFHSVTLSIPMIIGLVYLTEERTNSRWIVPLFILILFCRADLAPLLSAYSVYLFCAHKRRKLSIILLSVSIIWVIASRSTAQIREVLNLPEIINTNIYTGRWEHIGGTNPLDVVKGILKDPLPLVTTFINFENAKYLIKILAPFAFLPLVRPGLVFLALPSILINAASNWTPAHHIYHHYNAHVGAVFIIATVYAIGYLVKKLPGIFGCREGGVKVAAVLLLLVASSGSAAFKSNCRDIGKWLSNDHFVKLERIIEQVDGGKSVSSHFFLLDHAANREEIYLFPDNVGNVDLVIYDIRLPFDRIMSHDMIAHKRVDPLNEYLRELMNDPAYGVRAYDDGAIIFERGSNYEGGIRKLMEVTESSGYESCTMALDNGMVIDAYRRNGVVGANFDKLSYSLICRVEGVHRLEPITFLLEEDDVSKIVLGRTLLSSIEGLDSISNLEEQFMDEVCVEIPEDFDNNSSISIYVLGNDFNYHPFDLVEDLGGLR
jgi:uncharacterized membrane protein